jgi:hypothetical protein
MGFLDSYAAERRIVDERQRLHLGLGHPLHPAHSHDPRMRRATRSAIISFKKLSTRRSSLRSQFIAPFTLTPALRFGVQGSNKGLAKRGILPRALG